MDNLGKLKKTQNPKTEEEKRNKPENSVRFFCLKYLVVYSGYGSPLFISQLEDGGEQRSFYKNDPGLCWYCSVIMHMGNDSCTSHFS